MTSRSCGRSRTGSRSCTSARSWRPRREQVMYSRPLAPVYPLPALRGADPGSKATGAPQVPDRASRRPSEPDRPAERVRLPNALLPGTGALRNRGAAAGGAGTRPQGRMPLPDRGRGPARQGRGAGGRRRRAAGGDTGRRGGHPGRGRGRSGRRAVGRGGAPQRSRPTKVAPRKRRSVQTGPAPESWCARRITTTPSG